MLFTQCEARMEFSSLRLFTSRSTSCVEGYSGAAAHTYETYLSVTPRRSMFQILREPGKSEGRRKQVCLVGYPLCRPKSDAILVWQIENLAEHSFQNPSVSHAIIAHQSSNGRRTSASMCP